MRKTPRILIGLFGGYNLPSTVSARVSTKVQECSLHLCGFAQNKNRGLRQGEQSRVTGIYVRLSTRCPNLLEPTQSWHTCRINHVVQLQK